MLRFLLHTNFRCLFVVLSLFIVQISVAYLIVISQNDAPFIISFSEVELYYNAMKIPPTAILMELSSTYNANHTSSSNCNDGSLLTSCISYYSLNADGNIFIQETSSLSLTTKMLFNRIIIYKSLDFYTIEPNAKKIHIEIFNSIEHYKQRQQAIFSERISFADTRLVVDLDGRKYFNMNMKEKVQVFTIVVTGGAGFVGRHFVSRFCHQQPSLKTYHIVIIDDLSAKGSLHPNQWSKSLSCSNQVHNKVEFYKEDCRTFFKRKLDIIFEVDLFIHLASIEGWISKDPLEMTEHLAIDIAAFQWAEKMEPKCMIYFRSSTDYPIHHKIHRRDNNRFSERITTLDASDSSAFGETTEIPDKTYDWSKFTEEYVAYKLNGALDIPIAIYRPFSYYGEDQDVTYPFKDVFKLLYDLSNSLVAEINNDTKYEIEIWSNATRDFVYIEDIVDCVLSTYMRLSISTGEFQYVDLATGNDFSFEELVLTIADELGIRNYDNWEFKTHNNPQSKSTDQRVEPNKLASQYGCTFPTALRKGVKKMIAYQKELDKSYPSENSNEKILDDDELLKQKYKETFFTDSDENNTTITNTEKPKNSALYSSHHCVGSSQAMTNMVLQKTHKSYPNSTDPMIKTCHFRNVCLFENRLQYFKHPFLESVESEYFPNGFPDSQMLYVGYISPEPLTVNVFENMSFPTTDSKFHVHGVGLVDHNSMSHNYAHYLIDNVIPHLIAMKIFNLPIESGVQVFDDRCSYMRNEHPAWPLYGVTNSSLTYQEACTYKLNTMWKFFFDRPPIFTKDESILCFRDLVVGQGSAFSLKSLDLSRAINYRDFRDYTLKRLYKMNYIRLPNEADDDDYKNSINILVAVRGLGHYSNMENKEGDLCELTKKILFVDHPTTNIKRKKYCSFPEHQNDIYRCTKTAEKLYKLQKIKKLNVQCVKPDQLTFKQELQYARNAHIVISVHGTISYITLFAKVLVIYF